MARTWGQGRRNPTKLEDGLGSLLCKNYALFRPLFLTFLNFLSSLSVQGGQTKPPAGTEGDFEDALRDRAYICDQQPKKTPGFNKNRKCHHVLDTYGFS